MDIILKSGSSEDLNLVSGSSIIHVGESIISLSGSNFINMVEITYGDLVSLRNSSGLTPGFYYRIIDYVTVSVEDYSRSVYHGFDVIVLALNDYELCEDAYACVRDGEEDGYFSGNTLSAWKLKYCLDNDRDRFAWACPDDGAIQVDDVWKLRNAEADVTGATYPYAWGSGDSLVFTSSDEQIVSGDTCYSDSEGTGSTYTVQGYCVGRGVIYEMIDEFGNDLAYDFKNIQFFYREFFCEENRVLIPSGSSESTVIRAMAFKRVGMVVFYTMYGDSEDASSFFVKGETLTGNTWVDIYGSAQTIYPDGIYYPIGTNIYAPQYGNDKGYSYTFNTTVNTDASLTGIICDNVILPRFVWDDDNTKLVQRLNYNAFFSLNVSTGSYHNEVCKNRIGYDSYSNLIYNSSSQFKNNIIGNGFSRNNVIKTGSNGIHDNIIGNNFYNNMISMFGYHSSFGNEVQNNMMLTTNQCTIGNQFKNNGYTSSLWACDIGNNFHNNFMSGMTKDMSCGNNVYGIYCKSTTGLTIGNNVSNVVFGESVSGLSSYIKYFIIESSVQNVTINCTATTSTSSPCQNIKVCQGVHDTTLEIDVSGQDYQIEFKPVGSEIRNV